MLNKTRIVATYAHAIVVVEAGHSGFAVYGDSKEPLCRVDDFTEAFKVAEDYIITCKELMDSAFQFDVTRKFGKAFA
jgi:hypothetical protein